MPKLAKYLGGSVLAICLAGAVWAEGAAPTADTVVATVNGSEITLGHLVALREALPPQYAELPDDVLFEGVLEQMIQQTALAQIGEGRLTKRDHTALEVQRRAYVANSLLAYTADHAASDEDVLAAYNTKFGTTQPREYHAAHILVDTLEEAQKLKSEIDGGAAFADLAKEHSKDGAAVSGGDLGWFTLYDMVEPFADAVAAMQEGTISDPVQTKYGWHLIELQETRLTDAPSLEDVREQLEGDLRQQAVEARVTEAMEKTEVSRMVDGIDPAILKDPAILGN